jgi:hypothetical protein
LLKILVYKEKVVPLHCQKEQTTPFGSSSLTFWTLRNVEVKNLCKGAKGAKTNIFYNLNNNKRMEKIKLNGENWTNVVNANLKSGAKLEFESGFKCVVVEYYKAHHFKKGSKTALKIKVGKDVSVVETDKLRAEHCPEYRAIPHKTKVKTFAVTNLELATIEQLKELQKQIESELQKREQQKQKKIAELQKQLAELQNA